MGILFPSISRIYALAGTATFTGTSQELTGDVTAARIVDSANSAYFIDPAASGTSLSIAGAASISGNLTLPNGSGLRPAFGPTTLSYKSGMDAWTTGLIIQDGTGNVGIGTTSPLALLDVNGVSAAGLGAVGAPSFAIRTDLDTGMWSSGANTLNFSTGGSERVRIDGNGIGIGTTAPNTPLHVRGNTGSTPTAGLFDYDSAGATVLNLSDVDSGGSGAAGRGAKLQFSYGGVGGAGLAKIFGRHEGSNKGGLVFETASDTNTFGERMRITSAGNVGIGTTDPAQKLDVAGTVKTTGITAGSGTFLPVDTYAGIKVGPDTTSAHIGTPTILDFSSTTGGAAFSALVIVTGRRGDNGTNVFTDILIFSMTNYLGVLTSGVTVLGSQQIGTASTRSYSTSGYSLIGTFSAGGAGINVRAVAYLGNGSIY